MGHERIRDRIKRAQAEGWDELDLGLEGVQDKHLALVGSLRRLKRLFLAGSSITDRGLKHLRRLTGLHELALFGASIRDGVSYLAGMDRLQGLNLSNTQINDRGIEQLAKIKSLRELALNHTQITDLSPLSDLPNLQWLSVTGCTQLGLPAELLDTHEPEQIFDYWERVRGGKPLLELKVVIVGEGRVGKTQLRRRLAAETPAYQSDEPSTHDFEVRRFQLVPPDSAGKPVTVKLFDFGGQAELHSSHRFFLAGERNAYLLVLDARKSALENRLDYWMRVIQNAGEGAPVLLVVTWCDTPGRRRLAALEADRLAEQFAIPVWLVDGYSNETGAMFPRVAAALAEMAGTLNTIFRARYPRGFFAVKSWLEHVHPYIGPERIETVRTYAPIGVFRKACAAAGENDLEQQAIWLKMLRNLGVVHYVGDDPIVQRRDESVLTDLIFNPLWVKGPVYAIIRDARLSDTRGVFRRADLLPYLNKCRQECPADEPWRQLNFDERDARVVLALMRVCGLVFDVRGKDGLPEGYLVADQLPRSGPPSGGDAWGQWEDPREATLSYEFLPESLLMRFIGKWYPQVVRPSCGMFRDAVWVGLEDAGTEALVRADVLGRRITISVRSAASKMGDDVDQDDSAERRCNELRTRIRFSLEEIVPCTRFDEKQAVQKLNRNIAVGGPSGKLKVQLCRRLTADWADLADYFEIPAAKRRTFERGREPQAVWEWLEDRERLTELEAALEAINRGDLCRPLRDARLVFQHEGLKQRDKGNEAKGTNEVKGTK